MISIVKYSKGIYGHLCFIPRKYIPFRTTDTDIYLFVIRYNTQLQNIVYKFIVINILDLGLCVLRPNIIIIDIVNNEDHTLKLKDIIGR